jgi:peptidyl-prolyl cis-trans isomerase A (cyclophilin A)
MLRILPAIAMLLFATSSPAQSAAPPSVSSPLGGPAPEAAAPPTVTVRMVTSLGPLLLLIETGRAPITAANFLHYVDTRRFDGTIFYRAMTVGEGDEYGLLQGGLRGNPKRIFKTIAHEPTSLTGLSHVNGALSMARAAPGTASADFFIVMGDLTTLDAQPSAPGSDAPGDPGYAVFGHVLEGMDLVKGMIALPRSATAATESMRGQMLEMPVKILTVRRVQ